MVWLSLMIMIIKIIKIHYFDKENYLYSIDKNGNFGEFGGQFVPDDIKKDLDKILRTMITKFIENHKLSQEAHEEIMAMTHSDKEIAKYFHEHEIVMTNSVTNLLLQNGFSQENLSEKVHIVIHLIDDLCHEIVYHKHKEMNYDIMTDLTIKTIEDLLN